MAAFPLRRACRRVPRSHFVAIPSSVTAVIHSLATAWRFSSSCAVNSEGAAGGAATNSMAVRTLRTASFSLASVITPFSYFVEFDVRIQINIENLFRRQSVQSLGHVRIQCEVRGAGIMLARSGIKGSSVVGKPFSISQNMRTG